MAEDSELWDVICDGPFILMKTIGEPTVTVPKTRKEYNDVDRKAIEKNFRAKKILTCGIGQNEYNRISAYQSTKEIWEALQMAHEGTTQVKQSEIDMLTTEYEFFRMKDDESIQDMHTRFTSIINELHSLGEIIPRNKLVRKILSVLFDSWESKVNAIIEAKDLQKLTINELIGNMKTYEMKKKKDHERREPKKEKNMVLKADNNDSSDKATKRNPIPDKRFKRKKAADNVVKQALAAWGDSSSEDDAQGDTSMMAVKCEAAEYDSIFALMEKSDDDEDNDDDEEVVKGSSQKWYMDSVTNLVTDEVVLMAKRYKNIYVADFESLHNRDLICLSVVDDDAELWHTRLGHASLTLLNKLVKKDLVRRLPKSSFKDHKVCDACVKGKQVRSLFKTKKDVSTSRPLVLLHMVLCGPMRVPSKGGKRNIFVIVDDYSRFTWTLFLRTKDETFPVFAAFVKKIQVKMSHNVVSIRSDHGTEFDNAKFDEFCAENVGLQKSFWAEAVNTAYYLENRCMIRPSLNKTLYELLNGRKPKLTHLRTFGCKCFVLNNGKEALGKFDAKSDEGIFLGYSSQSKAYKVYKKRTQCLEESIHVIFDELHHICGKDSPDRIDQDGEQSKVLGEVIDMANGKAVIMSQVKESNEDGTVVPPFDIEEPSPSITTTEAENRVVDVVQGTPDAERRSSTPVYNGSHSEEPGSSHNENQVSNWKHKSSHPLQNVISPLDLRIQTRSKSRNSLAFSVFLSQIEPKNIKEALKDTDWITAMQDELHQFERNNAPHAWYERLSKFLLENGFPRGKIDNTLFLKKRGRNLIIVQIYVDDIIFGVTNDSLCEEFAKLIGSEFEMSMMGELNVFLGLQVKQTP
ncbi:uncharacterized protein LOC107784042 [Nicotiana tabacum]|uniref:Uncharacterized protein LOC107784042 n=1 Tax=Nicotiana tabacum TaxID=4097 RepID=A0AC58UBG8_TOBAC